MATQAEPQIWMEEGPRKREAVRQMFGEIAPYYDRLNGLMSLQMHHRWRAFATRLLKLKGAETVLDLCCGTGDFMPHLRKAVGPEGHVVGADFSGPMLALAAQKGQTDLALADAGVIPLKESVVDAITVGWGIRNVSDVDLTHREIARVLKPGGRFVSVDMAGPRNAFVRAASSIVCRWILPSLGALFGRKQAYTYLPKSVLRFQTREQLEDSMRRAGLTDVVHYDLLLGNVCVHFGRKPKGAESQ